MLESKWTQSCKNIHAVFGWILITLYISEKFLNQTYFPHTSNFLMFSDSLFSSKWLWSCLLANILIQAALQLFIWEFHHWECLEAAYMRISWLRIPRNCLPENFLIETALLLLTWKFPHWDCLVTANLKISSLRLPCDC